MKLIVAIVPHASRKLVRERLLAASLPLTQCDSVGGFLGRKSGTFLIGIEDARVEEAVEIIHAASRSRVETVSAPVLSSTDVSEAIMASDAARVTAGGATVFVLPVDRFEKA